MIDSYDPLSFSQERIWFLHKLDPQDRSYQFQATLTFVGPLDVLALERALERIVRRHEIFRTAFPSVAGTPVQRVESDATVAFELIDLSARADASALAIAAALARTFDVTRLPLVRWTLLRLSPEHHVLVHVEHHLVHDGWSFNVFLDELQQLYRAFAVGSDARLADAPAFTAFARRQRERAETPAALNELAYWKRTLAGAPALLSLPTDKRRPPVVTHSGDAIVSEVSAAMLGGVERLSRERAVTPFMTMFAAFAVLLARYGGETDVCIGTGVAGRGSPELEQLMGMVVNTVVLRVDLSGDPSFTELLERVKSVAFGAYENQHAPFERVVEAVAPVRDPSFNPLFSVLFSFHDSQQPKLDFGGLSVTLDQTMNNASAKMDLNVVCIPHRDGMTLKWEYNSDLFERETMIRMLAHFECLLGRILDEPERRISRLELMREPERRLVVERFAENSRPYPRDRSIDSLFEARAQETPHARALAGTSEGVTYLELEQRANRLARYLRRRGIASETRVAILMERSVDAVVAMLAVLKAGGTYVPLDVRFPLERMTWMLADSSVALTLTHGALDELLPRAVAIVRVDRLAGEISSESHEPLAEIRTASALAYVMYTSGSTGLPKGVCVTHRGVVRLATSGGDTEILPQDVVFYHASHAFDASTYEIWGALLSGATLAIPPRGMLSLAELAETLAQSHTTVLFLTAPLFHQMVESRLEGLRLLRLLVTGGDVVSPAHALRFVERIQTCRLVNGYGPTENATFTTTYTVSSSIANRKSTPIGKPFGNSSVYVLDAHDAPAPIDVPGEIWTGGDGVARGYLNRPELTAERFVTDPFSNEDGAMLYRTGDLGRWRADGTIEFLGRHDDQVKIRGFRIELGEVESALRRHPAVRDAAVSVSGPADGERMLLAYVVLDPTAAADAREIREFVSAQLPDYEVPSRITVLEALPSSAGGKVDRAALAKSETAQPAAAGGTLRGAVEERLGEIWRDVLRIPSVTRDDDFFDLGGHSLMAMRVLARLNDAFEIELSLRDLFERRTLAALAKSVELAPRIVVSPAIDVSSLSDEEIEALLGTEGPD